jgi:hypothetical protein
MKGGFHVGGGTILQMPNCRACAEIRGDGTT